MEPYDKLSEYFDLLHRDHDYDRDCDYVERLLEVSGLGASGRILDIGCGTGGHSIRLLERGHRVVGIDLSEPMLRKARSKAAEKHMGAVFALQDMKRIDLDELFDCAICLFGGFSRLSGQRELDSFLGSVRKRLGQGGLLVFDFVNTDGVVDGRRDWKIIEEEDLVLLSLDVSRLCGSVLDERHEILVLREDVLVDRFVENHKLQTHTLSEITESLGKHRFSLIEPGEKREGHKSFGIRVAALKT